MVTSPEFMSAFIPATVLVLMSVLLLLIVVGGLLALVMLADWLGALTLRHWRNTAGD